VRDYYYTLGVGRDASPSDIQQAYRKLSFKFHPEENGNDPFFALHYEKIKEAYQVLSDDHKRYRYDKAYEKQIAAEVDEILEAPLPVIAAFFASKSTVQRGDVITISWEVLNAETVRINLIGEVSTNGTQTVRLTVPSPSEPYLYLDLEARNHNSVQSSRKRLALKNSAYKAAASSEVPPPTTAEDLDWAAAIPVELDESTPPPLKPLKEKKVKQKKARATPKTATPSANAQKNAWAAYLLVAVLFLMIAVMLYTIFLINPVF
jgi:curved DNA-binding protein CbpA